MLMNMQMESYIYIWGNIYMFGGFAYHKLMM